MHSIIRDSSICLSDMNLVWDVSMQLAGSNADGWDIPAFPKKLAD